MRWGATFPGVALALLVSCSVPFTDDHRYTCAIDADCGGDGFVCVTDQQGVRACCHTAGAEVCGDGVDNDCNGLVDGADHWPQELCNGADDDCDGRVDETFFFEFDDDNCGGCGRRCDRIGACRAGACVP